MGRGAIIDVTLEKPAAGGRMIGRMDGRVVLVAGGIPGERVTARVERVAKDVVHAVVTELAEASPDRRTPSGDPQCGGCLYAHIAYARQRELKGLVVADALARIGRIRLEAAVPVAASPEDGYRMRARLHVRGGRVGFYREGTHDLCDARATRQLLSETSDVVGALASALDGLGLEQAVELEVSENVAATERAVLLGVATGDDARRTRGLAPLDGVSGLVVGRADGTTGWSPRWGVPYVTDRVALGSVSVALRRHVAAFFQGNRYLLGALAFRVIEAVPEEARVVDLYAGTGLFAVAAAVARGARVTAVEGDPVGAADLDENARQADGRVVAAHRSVEAFLAARPPMPDVLILDPPRTGVSRVAMDGVRALRAPRLVYVSCDPATLARDARLLVEAGYGLTTIEAFDLFPNTPHVETVAVFERAIAAG